MKKGTRSKTRNKIWLFLVTLVGLLVILAAGAKSANENSGSIGGMVFRLIDGEEMLVSEGTILPAEDLEIKITSSGSCRSCSFSTKRTIEGLLEIDRILWGEAECDHKP